MIEINVEPNQAINLSIERLSIYFYSQTGDINLWTSKVRRLYNKKVDKKYHVK